MLYIIFLGFYIALAYITKWNVFWNWFHALQPSCENMMIEIVEVFKKELPSEVTLVKVSLRETANSYSEWLAEDNL